MSSDNSPGNRALTLPKPWHIGPWLMLRDRPWRNFSGRSRIATLDVSRCASAAHEAAKNVWPNPTFDKYSTCRYWEGRISRAFENWRKTSTALTEQMHL